MFVIPNFSFAQYGGGQRLIDKSNWLLSRNGRVPDKYKSRFNEVGITSYVTSPTCEISYYIEDAAGNISGKSTITKLKPMIGYGLTLGSGIHFGEVGENGAIGININLMVNYTQATISSSDFMIKDKSVSFDEKVELFQWSLPMSLDYKMGAEARSNKDLKSMFAIGVGFAPKVISYDISGGPLNPYFIPFVKAEFGYVIGWAFKLRAMYFIGDQNLDSYGYSYNQSHLSSYHLSTGGEFVLGLIVMPYTGEWND